QRYCAAVLVLIGEFPGGDAQRVIKFCKLAGNGYDARKVIHISQLLGCFLGINGFVGKSVFPAVTKIINDDGAGLYCGFDGFIYLRIPISASRGLLLEGVGMYFFYVDEWL